MARGLSIGRHMRYHKKISAAQFLRLVGAVVSRTPNWNAALCLLDPDESCRLAASVSKERGCSVSFLSSGTLSPSSSARKCCPFFRQKRPVTTSAFQPGTSSGTGEAQALVNQEAEVVRRSS